MSNPSVFSVDQRDQTLRYLTIDRVTHGPDLEGLQPVGEIDLYTAPLLAHALHDLETRGVRGVVIDMSRVDFLAVAGVRVLQEATERAVAGHRRLVIANSSSVVKRVLVLTRTLDALDVRDTVTAAVTDLDEPANA